MESKFLDQDVDVVSLANKRDYKMPIALMDKDAAIHLITHTSTLKKVT